MKELMSNWIENHKGENDNGTWFVMDYDVLEGKIFATEKEIDDFLWDYIVDFPDPCLPLP